MLMWESPALFMLGQVRSSQFKIFQFRSG